MNQYEAQFEKWLADCDQYGRVIIDHGFEELMIVQTLLFFCWLESLKDLDHQKEWADAFGKWAHHRLHHVELHFQEAYAYELMQQWNALKEKGAASTQQFLSEETDLLANPVLAVAFNYALETFMDSQDIHWLVISQADLKEWDFQPGMIIGWADGSKEEQGVVLDIRPYQGMIFFLLQQSTQTDPIVRLAAIDGEFENGLITPKQSWLDGFLQAMSRNLN